MALLPVTLAELLRPWRAAGITHLLGDAEVTPGAWTTTFPRPPLHSNPETPPNAYPREDAGRKAPLRDIPPAAPQETSPPQTAHFPDRPAVPEPALWPGTWAVLRQRTAPAPLVWTYPELGEDLSGHGSKARGDCLRHLITRLALPKGSSAFWPLQLPGTSSGETAREPAQSGDAVFFQAGLEYIAPSGVILLGSASIPLTGLPLDLRIPFTQQIVRGRMFVLLPAFAELLSGTEAVERAAVYLRTAFSGVRGLRS